VNKDVFNVLFGLIVFTNENATARWNVLRRITEMDMSREQVATLLGLESDQVYRLPQDIKDKLWGKLADLSTTLEELCDVFSRLPNTRKWRAKRRELIQKALDLSDAPSELGVFVPHI
jgi:hypothetical protein